MTSSRWAEIKAVVAGAMDTPAGERKQYLDCACGEDSELRHEVESLLAAADGPDSLPGARAAIASARDHYVVESGSSLRAAIERGLGHQYDILRKIGEGGMGEVFLARERALDRLVAIKVLRPDLAEASQGRERFRREARIAAQLSHPGILPLHAFGETEGLWYFVMSFVRGQSLGERLRLEGRLPPEEARRILLELVDALDCAHRHGVVHRDIKPSNILLDEESGRAVLADFGISKLIGAGDGLTTTGLVVGSPHYMSPEQGIGAADVDERSDFYSLGAVAYTMLAGREPFADASVQELISRRLLQAPLPLAAVAPSVPRELADVVMRCLRPEPAQRWSSARELKDALAHASGEATPLLPEDVRDLPSFGPYAVAWAVAWTVLAFVVVSSQRDRALMLLVALLVPVGLLLHVWNTGRHGLRPLELARIAAWPPEWWGVWWPRALRRPTDLWSRLPWQARLVRIVLTIFLIGLPGLILFRQQLVEAGGPSANDAGIVDAGEAILFLVTGSVVAGGLWWTGRKGLSLSEGARVLFGATLPSPVWGRPHVARLLTPPAGGVRPPDRDAPADHRRAISELVALLPAPAAGVGPEVLRASQRLSGEIERCDREIASLARDAGPAEVDRLTSQLAALETSTAGADDERGALRALVQQQLELVRRLQGRYELVSQERARLFYLLRGLWAQLCVLRNAGDAGPLTTVRLRDRVRALCQEIEAEVGAEDERPARAEA